MNKLLMFFMFMLVGCAILSGIMEGGGGLASTPLIVAVDEDDITFLVSSTNNFLDQDYITIGDEIVLYGSTNATAFFIDTRGYRGTTPASHSAGAMVYTTQASAVNHALNFNVAAMVDTMGLLAFPAIFITFFIKTVPQLVMWNYSFLSGDLAILGFFFFASGAAFIITLALTVLGARRV